MIVTLTFNPAVDKTIRVHSLAMGRVNRVSESQLDSAGKGINVSRVVDRLGWPTIAFGFLAGEIGMLVARALNEEGVQSHFLSVPGQTRLNVTIFDEATGNGTSFFDHGPQVSSERMKDMHEVMRPWLRVCQVLVLAGSLPPGVPDNAYADYIRLGRSMGVKTILDADGDPLRLGVQARPYLIKPNLSEAEHLMNRPLPDLSAVQQAALEITANGIEVAVISMGARGAIGAQRGQVWHAIPPKIQRQSTVGSGDSMVAGLAVALAQGLDIVEGLKLGTAAGAATAMTPGTSLAAPEDIASLLPQVQIRALAK